MFRYLLPLILLTTVGVASALLRSHGVKGVGENEASALPSMVEPRSRIMFAHDDVKRVIRNEVSAPRSVVEPRIRLMSQTGHADFVTRIAFSLDRRFALTASQDHTLKLWDMESGIELRNLAGHTSEVSGAAFSPDGRLALSIGFDGVKLWDLATGKDLQRFGDANGAAALRGNVVAFSPDGRLGLIGGGDGSLTLWDIASGQPVRSLIGQGSGREVWDVHFSPDGRQVLSRTLDNTIRLSDVATGEELRRIDLGGVLDAPIAFSPDGRQILTGGDNSIVLWDATLSKQLHVFRGTDTPRTLAFSRDGHVVIAAGGSDVQLLDARSGQTLRKISTEDVCDVKALALSLDGRMLFAGCGLGPVITFDMEGGREVRRFSAPTREVTSAAFSPDGRYILTGGSDRIVRLWESTTGRNIRSFIGHPEDGVEGVPGCHVLVGFSPDGSFAFASFSGITGGTLFKRWDLATGKEVHALVKSDVMSFDKVTYSPDGRLVAAARLNEVEILDLEAEKRLRTLSIAGRIVGSLAFSTDGHLLLVGGDAMQLWKVSTGQALQKFDNHYGSTAMALSPDGRIVANADASELSLWEVATGKRLRTLKGKTESAKAVALSSDGRLILAAGRDRLIKLWDVETGQELRTFGGHAGDVEVVAFSPDGRRALSGAADGTTRIWDVQTGREIATLSGGPSGEWLTMTPFGFFSASHRDTNMLALVRDLEPTTIGQVYQSLFNPDLVRESLAGDTGGEVEQAAKLVSLERVLDAGPAPQVALTSPPANSRTRSDIVTATVRIADRGKGVGRIEWRVNGVTTAMAGMPAGAGAQSEIRQTLALDPGQNLIEVIAYDGRNLLASRPARTTIVLDGPLDVAKPKLHVLAIGINAYIDKGGTGSAEHFPPLNLAVADARAFAGKMREAGAGLYGDVLITEAFDDAATKAGLDRIFDQLSPQIGPRDTFVLYAAAHGISREGRFYLIPQDYQGGGDPGALSSRAITQAHLQDWLANRIRARKAIILLDTCESGALVNGYDRSRMDLPDAEFSIGRLHEATGRPVLTAAASGRPAFEGYKGHGVFTYALMEALHSGDSNGDGNIELSEFVIRVQDLVPQLSAELNGRGIATVASRGFKDDKQSARFGSTGEDFVLARRLP